MSALSRAVARPSGYLGRHQSLTVVVVIAITGVLLPILALVPPFSGFTAQAVWVDSFAGAGVFVLLALGLNVVVGLAGLLDLGYAAFFAIGAYSYAYLASNFSHVHASFWMILPAGAFVAALFGVMLGAPTLRLRGDYLAIVTLGFGEIVPVVFRNSDTLTNGTNGISGLDQPELATLTFGSNTPWAWYGTMLVLLALAAIILFRLQDSRLGRAWMAVREDEQAAASMGINTITTKLLAFAMGAATAGLAGVFYASKLTLASPDEFGFTVSFTILAMVVLGGMGNIWGVAAGAFVLYEIQTLGLKQMNTFVEHLNIPIVPAGVNQFLQGINFNDYQFLLYGLALVAMMLLRPEGLFPSRRRQAELHDVADAGQANEELVQP